MRVLSIGLDSRVADADSEGHAVRWAREISRLVDEYVIIVETHARTSPVSLANNVMVYPVPASKWSFSVKGRLLARRIHKARPFDVCTAEDPIRAGLSAALFSRRTGVPLNIENHSRHINNPHWIHQRFHHRYYNRIARWVVRRADTIRIYSPAQEQALLDLGIARERICAIPAPAPNPYPPMDQAGARASLGLPPTGRIVLTAGRMVPTKNIDTLLRAFHRLPDLYTRENVHLVLAGDGISRSGWEALSRQLDMAERVSWLGQVPESVMPALYQAADVFITTSKDETGPRTVLEAFAAGCPVIATPDVGAVHFGILHNGVTGWVVKPCDFGGFSGAIREALDALPEAREKAKVGQSRLERYSYTDIARQVVDLWQKTAA